MSIRALKTLLVIAEGEWFQAAANRLNMTPSAVSMQMKQLEEIYQATLFDRSTRPPSLTRTGLGLAEASRSVVTAYDDLSVLVRTSSPLRGKLALGVVVAASIRLLPKLTQQLMAQFPNVKLQVESALSVELADKVLHGTLDAAVVTETKDLDAELVVSPLVSERLVLVAAKEERRRLSRDLLRKRPFIRFQPWTGVGQLIDQFLVETSTDVSCTIVLDSLEAIVELVALNLGVTIIPEPEASRYGQGRVVWTANLNRPLSRTLALITRRTPGSLALHDALLELFRDTFSIKDLRPRRRR
jgi:DNA-binding transcriptional LysR family regulator